MGDAATSLPAVLARLPRVQMHLDGRIVPVDLHAARSFLARLRGLLGTSALPAGFGLWISPCSSIHMLGMRYGLEVVFLDRHHRVLAVCDAPVGALRRCRSAASAIEWAPGTAAALGIGPGAQLVFQQAAVVRHAAA